MIKFLKILAVILFYFAWGTYYVLLKPRFVDLNASYIQILLIDSIPAVIALTSILWGRLADLISRRAFLAFSAIGGFVIVFFGFCSSINSLLLLLAILSVFSSMALPVINALFSFETEVEASFALYLLAEAAGWMLSGIFIGYFSKTISLMRVGYSVGAFCWVLGVLILVYIMGRTPTVESRPENAHKLKINKPLLNLMLGIFFLELGIVISYGILSVKLYETLNRSKLIYGIVWATLPSFASVLVSRFYGGIVRRVSPWNSLIMIAVIYLININVLRMASGYVMAFFWILPLWNFMYIALYSAVTRVSEPEVRASAFGLTNSVLNLAMAFTILGGFLSDRFGQSVGLGAGVFSVVLSLLFFNLLKSEVKVLKHVAG
jgi:MFS family permease